MLTKAQEAYRGALVAPALARRVQRLHGSRAGKPLTACEQRVLACIARGLANKEIMRELSLAEGTVKVHVSRILDKLGVNNRTKAALAYRSGEPARTILQVVK